MKRRDVLWAVLMLAVFIGLGVANGHEPDERVLPQPTVVPAAEQPSLNAGAQVYQTMFFTRCGHSVSRRTDAAAAVQGASFEAVRSYYDVWTILEMTEERVEMVLLIS